MISIFKKEFRSYFTGVTGSVFIAFLLGFCGIYVTAINLRGGLASFEYVLSNIIIVFLLIVPILTMRSFAEEKHSRTDQLLYSLPVRVIDIVLGKYLAMLAVFFIPVLIMSIYPIILSGFGMIFFKACYCAILGFFLLGAALIAICMFMSSLTESQVISAVISFGVLLLMYMMNGLSTIIPASELASFLCFAALAGILAIILFFLTRNGTAAAVAMLVMLLPLCIAYFVNSSLFAGLFPKVLSYVAVFERFLDLTGGILDLTSIIYLISVTVFFVYLTVQSVEKRRWN